MPSTHFISIREFCRYHTVDQDVILEYHSFGLIRLVIRESDDHPLIPDDEIETLEIVLRLHRELDINLAGIETILHMREKIVAMQKRLKDTENLLQHYKKMLG